MGLPNLQRLALVAVNQGVTFQQLEVGLKLHAAVGIFVAIHALNAVGL